MLELEVWCGSLTRIYLLLVWDSRSHPGYDVDQNELTKYFICPFSREAFQHGKGNHHTYFL